MRNLSPRRPALDGLPSPAAGTFGIAAQVAGRAAACFNTATGEELAYIPAPALRANHLIFFGY